MSRRDKRERAKGRRGGEGERFAYIPESVLLSDAVCSLPHAAFKVLAILNVGRPKERNGTQCCSESYAAKFGITSRDTVRRSLNELQQRGLIVITRRVSPFMKFATLYGVTWWAILYRNGEPLDIAEPATHAYLRWSPTPMVGADKVTAPGESSHRWSDSVTPTVGVETSSHHTDGAAEVPNLHTDGRGKSLDLGSGVRQRSTRASPPGSLARGSASSAQLPAHLISRLMASIQDLPHLTDRDHARTFRCEPTEVARVRERLARLQRSH